ncbi:MAG TPA: hypothetical protein VLT33_44965 [Labilithrix sp.]|nr:hypothetical protein [Labilithrix sp.]
MNVDPSAKSSPKSDLGDWIAAWVVGSITLIHLAYYFPRIVDDAFISLRFAENLANGRGAVYNVGERVEGYSGPSWMLLQSVGLALGAEGVTWTKLLGVGSLIALQLGVYRMARQMLGVSKQLAVIACLFLGANSLVIDWSTLGLETPLHLAMIVWCPVAVDGFLKRPWRRTRLAAVAAIVGLATTRPESMLYVGVTLLAPLLAARSRRDVLRLARRLLRVAVPAGIVLAALLALRWSYYGRLLPQTYTAKGAAVELDLHRLLPLVAQGASLPEAVLDVGGTLLLLAFGWRRRALAPALTILACLYFTAAVSLDWMPNLRHLLPVTVLAPLGWLTLAEVTIQRGRVRNVIGWGCLALLGVTAQFVARVDSRNSPYEQPVHGWVQAKKAASWRGSVLAYRRLESADVRDMDGYNLGQITQAWGVLETSRAPVEDSWYFGRDIGAVGYYTGVRVFDTEGLFTPAVSDSQPWRDHRQVDDALIARAMAPHPLAAEIYDSWSSALGRNPQLLRGYRVRVGTTDYPSSLLGERATPPDRAEILRRYDALAAKLPRLYYLHTLYGESMGAAVEKRRRVVQQQPPEAFDP